MERLAGVVVASVSLGIAEREQAKKEKLEDLNVGFWKAVQDQNEPLRVIHITRNLEDLWCTVGLMLRIAKKYKGRLHQWENYSLK